MPQWYRSGRCQTRVAAHRLPFSSDSLELIRRSRIPVAITENEGVFHGGRVPRRIMSRRNARSLSSKAIAKANKPDDSRGIRRMLELLDESRLDRSVLDRIRIRITIRWREGRRRRTDFRLASTRIISPRQIHRTIKSHANPVLALLIAVSHTCLRRRSPVRPSFEEFPAYQRSAEIRSKGGVVEAKAKFIGWTGPISMLHESKPPRNLSFSGFICFVRLQASLQAETNRDSRNGSWKQSCGKLSTLKFYT